MKYYRVTEKELKALAHASEFMNSLKPFLDNRGSDAAINAKVALASIQKRNSITVVPKHLKSVTEIK